MKVLCAVDGSKYSQWAGEMLRRWAFPEGSTLVLVHVVDVRIFKPARGLGKAERAAMNRALDLAEQSGRGVLERMKATVRSRWTAVDCRLLRGRPAETIARAADKQKADLIVIGSRGLTDFRPFLMGSVSRRVVMSAPCPVLVIKKRISKLRRILVAADGSPEASAAVKFLLQMPLPKEARFTVVSVVPPFPTEAGMEPERPKMFLEQVMGSLEGEARNVATRAAEGLKKAGFEATPHVLQGPPAPEIVKLAESEPADLVVLGSRGLSGVTWFPMGSVSDDVIMYAPCLVLVFRQRLARSAGLTSRWPVSFARGERSGPTVECA